MSMSQLGSSQEKYHLDVETTPLIFINRQRKVPTFVGVVGLDVPDVVPGELVDGLLDLGQAALLAHPLRREVGVRTRPAPLTLQNIH